MRVKTRLLLLSVAAIAALLTPDASGYGQDADTIFQNRESRLQRSNKLWTQNDNCGKESFQKFPDFTAPAAAQRDAYMRECLRRHRLPPRADLAQPQRPPEQ
jgi:hypothetical protein